MQPINFRAAINQAQYDFLKKEFRHDPDLWSIANVLACTTVQYLEQVVTADGIKNQYALLRKIRKEIDVYNQNIAIYENSSVKTAPDKVQQLRASLAMMKAIDDRLIAVLDMYETRKIEIDKKIRSGWNASCRRR